MPFNRKLYPPDWESISWLKRNQAGWQCEWCGIAQGAVRENGAKVVLTVAHYPDSNPQNCTDENLHALCQSCHNRADHPSRMAHARITRLDKKQQRVQNSGQQELFS